MFLFKKKILFLVLFYLLNQSFIIATNITTSITDNQNNEHDYAIITLDTQEKIESALEQLESALNENSENAITVNNFIENLQALMNNGPQGFLSQVQTDRLKNIINATNIKNYLTQKQLNFAQTNSKHLEKNTQIKPFSSIPVIHQIPPMKNIIIKNPFFIFGKEESIITGDSTVLECPVKITFVKNFDGNGTIMGVPIMPKKLTDFIPEIKNTPLNLIGFPTPTIVISSSGYTDKKQQVIYPSGLSFFGVLDTKNSYFSTLKKIIPGLPKTVYCGVSSSIIPNIPPILSIVFSMAISEHAKIGATHLENIIFELSVKPPKPDITLAFKGIINAHLPKQKDPVNFIAECAFSADPAIPGITIGGTMDGTWKNVFGIKGLSIEDVGLEFGVEFIPAAPFVIPSELAYTGAIGFGNKKIMVASKISDDGEYVLQGKFDGSLSFQDLILTANKLGAPIPKNTIPNELAKIEDIDLKIATQTTTISDILFLQGITMRGTVTLFGKQATIDINMDPLSGIYAAGSISAINICNLFILEGKKFDKKNITENDGPTIKIALTPEEQVIYFSGSIMLFGLTRDAYVKIDTSTIYLETSLDLFGLASITLTGKTIKNKSITDLFLKGEMNAITINLSKEDFHTALEYLNDEIKTLNDTYSEKIADINNKIIQRQNTLKENSEFYRKTLNTFESAQKATKNAQEKVTILKNRIRELTTQLDAKNITTIQNITEKNLLLTYINQQKNIFLSDFLIPTTIKPTMLYVHNISSLGDKFKKSNSTINHGIKTATNKTIQTSKDAINPITNATEKAETEFNNIGKKIADKTEILKDLTTKAKDKTEILSELAALKIALESATITLEAAKKIEQLTEEALKNIDPEIISLRFRQGLFSTEYTANVASLETAKGMVHGALAIHPALNALSTIHIKKLTISGSILNPIPKIRCTIIAFNEEITLSFDSSDLNNLKKIIFKKCLPLLKKLKP